MEIQNLEVIEYYLSSRTEHPDLAVYNILNDPHEAIEAGLTWEDIYFVRQTAGHGYLNAQPDWDRAAARLGYINKEMIQSIKPILIEEWEDRWTLKLNIPKVFQKLF